MEPALRTAPTVGFAQVPADAASLLRRWSRRDAVAFRSERVAGPGGENIILTNLSEAGPLSELAPLRGALRALGYGGFEFAEPMAFIQSGGGGLEVHVDPGHVVSWQVAGEKRWTVYGDSIPEYIRSLRLAFRAHGGGPLVSDYFKTTPLSAGWTTTLGPGDFIIIPPWAPHETRTEGRSFSVSVELASASAAPAGAAT